ncbi:MAG: acetylhydrolase [Acetobacteraceae bacterium]|nr:acetylhydrolase [Acetobacteraceae bacterium]
MRRRALLLATPFLARRAAAMTEHVDAWRDPARDRALPVRLRLPAGSGPAPAVLISHGLGGSREGLAYLGRALAEAGFVALHVQHPGSDAAIWQGGGNAGMALAAAAFDVTQAVARLRDGVFALDELLRRVATRGDALHGRVDASRLAAAGHSYGAWTVQHLIGQRLPGPGVVPGLVLPDPRLRAGIALSPVRPQGLPPRVAFASVRVPLLSVTGTRDAGYIENATPADREIPFRSIAGVPQALAVLDGATHGAFADEAAAGPRWAETTFHARTAALCVAFLRAVLDGDAMAARMLRQGVQGMLQPGDRLDVKDWPG